MIRTLIRHIVDSVAEGLKYHLKVLISSTFNMRKRPTNYCTIKHMFPGGYIPSLAETLILMEKYGLDVRSIENRSISLPPHRGTLAEEFESHW